MAGSATNEHGDRKKANRWRKLDFVTNKRTSKIECGEEKE